MRSKILPVALALTLAACSGDEGSDPIGPVAAAISLSPESVKLVEPGDTARVMATVTDAQGGVLTPTITWSSDDPSVLSVDGSGLVTAVAPGSATITAEAEGVQASIPGDVLEYFVYVAVSNRNQLTIIDSRTNEVIDSVSVGSGPWSVAVTPDASSAYVANVSADSVARVDLVTRSVTRMLEVTGHPVDAAVTPDGSSIFVVSDNDIVSVIDRETHSVVEIVATSGSLRGIDFSPDGSLGYILDVSDSQLLLVDVAARAVTDSVSLPTAPRAIAVTHSGDEAVIADLVDSVTVLDLATETVVETLPVGGNPRVVVVSPDDALAYVGNNASEHVSVIDLGSLAVVDSLNTGASPNSVAFTPDGTSAYVGHSASNDVAVVDVATGVILTTIPVGGSAMSIAVARPPMALGSPQG